MADDRQLWDRQKGERADRFAAFALYRDGGPGYSLRALYEDEFAEASTQLRTLERWCSQGEWLGRREAYYDHLDRQRQSRRLHAIAEAENLLIEKASDLMKAALDAAIEEGDVRAQKDLLDRLGLTRKKAESGENAGINISVEAFQVALQHATLGELVTVLGQIDQGKV